MMENHQLQEYEVPNKFVGFILGGKGSKIKALEKKFNVSISISRKFVDEDGNPWAVFLVEGEESDNDKAIACLKSDCDKVSTLGDNRQSAESGRTPTADMSKYGSFSKYGAGAEADAHDRIEVMCPSSIIGFVLGGVGGRCARLRKEHNVSISVVGKDSKSGGRGNIVTNERTGEQCQILLIVGPRRNCEAARDQLLATIEEVRILDSRNTLAVPYFPDNRAASPRTGLPVSGRGDDRDRGRDREMGRGRERSGSRDRDRDRDRERDRNHSRDRDRDRDREGDRGRDHDRDRNHDRDRDRDRDREGDRGRDRDRDRDRNHDRDRDRDRDREGDREREKEQGRDRKDSKKRSSKDRSRDRGTRDRSGEAAVVQPSRLPFLIEPLGAGLINMHLSIPDVLDAMVNDGELKAQALGFNLSMKFLESQEIKDLELECDRAVRLSGEAADCVNFKSILEKIIQDISVTKHDEAPEGPIAPGKACPRDPRERALTQIGPESQLNRPPQPQPQPQPQQPEKKHQGKHKKHKHQHRHSSPQPQSQSPSTPIVGGNDDRLFSSFYVAHTSP